MAERLAFHYLPGTSVLHRWEPRCKLLGLIGFSLLALSPDPIELTLLSLTLVPLFIAARLPVRLLIRTLRGWAGLLVVIFCVQALTGGPISERLAAWLPVTRQTLSDAAIMIWRLLLMLFGAVSFTAVTRPVDLRDALIRLLRPFPLPQRRIAVMVQLTLRLLTSALDLAYEVRLANRSRLTDLSPSPLRRIKALVLPLARKAFRRADDLAIALAARGYREDLRLPPMPVGAAHWLPLLLYGGAVLAWRGLRAEGVIPAVTRWPEWVHAIRLFGS